MIVSECSAPGNTLMDARYAYSISFVADGARLLQEEGHIRYPDNEDYQVFIIINGIIALSNPCPHLVHQIITIFITISLINLKSYADWIDDIGWGGCIEHYLTPLTYSREMDNSISES